MGNLAQKPARTRTLGDEQRVPVKTILNRIQKHRGFVCGTVQLEEQIAGRALTVDLGPHRRNRPRCGGCGQSGPVYDRQVPRPFEFVPLWGLACSTWNAGTSRSVSRLP